MIRNKEDINSDEVLTGVDVMAKSGKAPKVPIHIRVIDKTLAGLFWLALIMGSIECLMYMLA